MKRKKSNIISFEKFKQEKKERNKKDYILETIIYVDLKRNKKGCTIDVYTENNIKIQSIYARIIKCLNHISKDVPQLYFDPNEYFEAHFSILYFINSTNHKDINPIFVPNQMSKEQIAKYLYVTLIMLEDKNRTT